MGRLPRLVPHDVLLISGDARRDRERPPDLLQLRGDVTVIQVGIIAAVAADELEHVGTAALGLTVDDADRLAPQNQRPARPGLPTGRPACLLRDGSQENAVVRTTVIHCSIRARGAAWRIVPMG